MKNIMKKFSNSFFRASVIVALFAITIMMVPANNTQTAHASLQDELNALNQQLDSTNQVLETKKSEIKTLEDQINVLNEQINQTELQIQATETKIKILNEQITQTEQDLKIQQETLNEYLRVIYEESNTSPLEQIVSANSFSDFVDRSEYLQTMQMKIKDMVDKIKQMKADLENNKKEAEKMKDQLSSQRSDLSSKRSAQSSLLSMAQSNAELLQKDVNALVSKRGAIYCLISGGCGGDINGNLERINSGPYYYSQLDPRWSNREYTPGSTFGSFGCLITSYAMVRSMITGTEITPEDEAKLHSYSNGDMNDDQYTLSIGGRPQKLLYTDWGGINAALDRGKPVIAGLSMSGTGYSTHFVVIVSRSVNTNTYFINDPLGKGLPYNSSRVFKAWTY